MLPPFLVTDAEPPPVDPEPLDPEPLDPEPVEPEPVDPEPLPEEPVPAPAPVEPEPVEPEPVEPDELAAFFFFGTEAVEVLPLEVEVDFFFVEPVEEGEADALATGAELAEVSGVEPVLVMFAAVLSVLAVFDVNPASVEV